MLDWLSLKKVKIITFFLIKTIVPKNNICSMPISLFGNWKQENYWFEMDPKDNFIEALGST